MVSESWTRMETHLLEGSRFFADHPIHPSTPGYRCASLFLLFSLPLHMLLPLTPG
jgi:hypothetical protein